MKLACGDHTFPMLDHDVTLDLIAGMGFEGFDLALQGNRSHIRPENIRHDLAGAAADISTRVAARGLTLSDVFVIPWTSFDRYAPNHPDADEAAASRALFEDMFILAQMLEAPGITMVPGVDFASLGHDASLEKAAEELLWRAQRCAAAGMRFSVECHIGSVAGTPDDALRLVELAPQLRLTLDYTHFIAQGFEQADVDRLVPHAGHVQVRGGRPGRGQCSLAENTIDYEAVIDRLADAGYDDYVTVEYVWIEWEHMNECDNVSETVMLRDRLRDKFAGRPWRYQGANT